MKYDISTKMLGAVRSSDLEDAESRLRRKVRGQAYLHSFASRRSQY